MSKVNVVTRSGRINKNNKKRLIRYGLVFGNIIIVAGVFGLIATNSTKNTTNYTAFSTAEESQLSNPLDALSATDIAVNVALMTELPETGLIINDADAVKRQLTTEVTTREAVLKPQILSDKIKTKEDIREYTVKDGDSLADLANKFGVTSDSIKWSNDINGTYLQVGSTLKIPPLNGIVHKVASGDTAKSLASKYSVGEDAIINFNDAEISGLVQGDYIVIPDGKITVAPVARTPYYARFAFGNSAVYGYNGYSYGYCTWYVANKRSIPANWGSAYAWDEGARASGFTVSKVPIPGSILQDEGSLYGLYHVAYVEAVYPDGSVLVSEMNGGGGWGVISSQVHSAASLRSANVDFIY